MNLQRLSLAEWQDALPDAGYEPFHETAVLSVLEDHIEAEVHLLGGFKGERPVALLPLFVKSFPVGKIVTSPLPGMGIPQLGPIMMPASPKQRKREKVSRTFVEQVVDTYDLEDFTTLFTMSCRPAFEDPRQYVWSGLALDTKFTYQIDVSGRDVDELSAAASKSLRREIRDADDLGIDVRQEGTDALKRVYVQTRERYAEQGKSFTLPWGYVRDLYEALDDRARVYVARSEDDEFQTGVTVFYSPGTAYFWQGGGRTVHDGVAVNSRIHWQIVEDLVEDPALESVTSYDMVGANTERLCQYKSKFGGELVPYYVLETSGYRMNVAKALYDLVK